MVELWDEGVYLEQIPWAFLCSWSQDEIDLGDYAVRLDHSRVRVWFSLASVDEIVDTARGVSHGRERTAPADSNGKVFTGAGRESWMSCEFCERDAMQVDAWLCVRYPVVVCVECLDDFADALERVWEHGLLVGEECG